MKKQKKMGAMPKSMPSPLDAGGGDPGGPMPGAQPMSTPTPPGLPAGPVGGSPAMAPGPKFNSDNLLPPAAFHKR